MNAAFAVQKHRCLHAVATPQGLVTPIIKNADTKSIQQMSVEAKALAAKAPGKLKPEEFMAAGFTVSNLGMYGIKEFSAIINPAAGLHSGRGRGGKSGRCERRPVGHRHVMTCTLRWIIAWSTAPWARNSFPPSRN